MPALKRFRERRPFSINHILRGWLVTVIEGSLLAPEVFGPGGYTAEEDGTSFLLKAGEG
jgi:hypothetical protein